MSYEVSPVIVILDGENKPFRSYMECEEVNRIANIGFSNADQLHLRETDDRIIPTSLKNGITCIKDVWVVLTPGPDFQG